VIARGTAKNTAQQLKTRICVRRRENGFRRVLRGARNPKIRVNTDLTVSSMLYTRMRNNQHEALRNGLEKIAIFLPSQVSIAAASVETLSDRARRVGMSGLVARYAKPMHQRTGKTGLGSRRPKEDRFPCVDAASSLQTPEPRKHQGEQ